MKRQHAEWEKILQIIRPTKDLKKKTKTKTQSKNGPRSEWILLQRRHTDGQKHMKRCSASLIIREKQIKSTMKCHHTGGRMAIIRVYK